MAWLGFLIGLLVGETLGVLMIAVLRAGAELDDAMGRAERGGSSDK